MGMFSEVHAAYSADRLEKILRAGLEQDNADVTAFLKEHLYPYYESEVGETWGGHEIPNDIRETFGPAPCPVCGDNKNMIKSHADGKYYCHRTHRTD